MRGIVLWHYLYCFIFIPIIRSCYGRWMTSSDELLLNNLMNCPNYTDTRAVCDQITGLPDQHKEICYHSPAIILAIGEGNRRTLKHIEKIFEEDQLPQSLLIYNNIFSFRVAESSKREIVYLASVRSSAIAHELALVCSDGVSETTCPCYRPPMNTNPEYGSALSTPLVLDQGCPYALAHAQRIALEYVLEDPEISVDTRHMIREHVIAAVKSIEAGWIDPEEEWESKFRELDEGKSAFGQYEDYFEDTLSQHAEL